MNSVHVKAIMSSLNDKMKLSGAAIVRTYTCGGTQNYCGHPGCPDNTQKIYKTKTSECGHPDCPDESSIPSCGGKLTNCKHPWDPFVHRK